MRILALDIGEKRIGVAWADDRLRVALPLATITANDDPIEAVAHLVEQQQAGELVVGLPLSLSGALGPQARRVQGVVDALARRLPIPVRTWDERLTSVQAARQQAGRRPKGELDAAAAAIILQAYLDSQPKPTS